MLNQEKQRKYLPLWIQSFINVRDTWKTIYIDKTKDILLT